MMTNNIFAVIIAAAAGEGASIATDILDIDLASRRPVVPTVEGFDFGTACVEALRLLGANMILSEQGPLFALALTRGIHKVVSVVSHTDEGGVNRDMLRTGHFGVPFGGIHHEGLSYTGLPTFTTSGHKELAAWVDAIALTTAAAVAHSDPGVEYDGAWYPTLYDGTGSRDTTVEPGIGQGREKLQIARNRNSLINDYPKFLELYISMLSYIFGCPGNNAVAVRFQSAVGMQLSSNCEHLKHPTVTPFFWIEPTSLLPMMTIGTPAEQNSICNFGGKNQMRSVPAFEQIVASGASNGISSGYVVRMRSARNSGIINFLNGHVDDGLAAIALRQADPMSIVQPGGPDETVISRLTRGAKINEYLWVRGQSPFCAPGEFMSINPSYGIYVQHAAMDSDGYSKMMHVPNNREFADAVVHYHVGVPTGLMMKAPNTYDSAARRARTRATRELAAVNARLRVYNRADMNAMAVSFSAPIIPQKRDARLAETVTGEGSSAKIPILGDNEPPPREHALGDAGVVKVTPQHGPVTYPQAVRTGHAETGRAVAKATHQKIVDREQTGVSEHNITPILPTAIPAAGPVTAILVPGKPENAVALATGPNPQ